MILILPPKRILRSIVAGAVWTNDCVLASTLVSLQRFQLNSLIKACILWNIYTTAECQFTTSSPTLIRNHSRRELKIVASHLRAKPASQTIVAKDSGFGIWNCLLGNVSPLTMPKCTGTWNVECARIPHSRILECGIWNCLLRTECLTSHHAKVHWNMECGNPHIPILEFGIWNRRGGYSVVLSVSNFKNEVQKTRTRCGNSKDRNRFAELESELLHCLGIR